MSNAIDMNVIELVQKIAKDHGRELSFDEADAILWNKTGFPCFFKTKGTYEEVLTPRLIELFSQSEDHDPGCATGETCWCDKHESKP